MNSPALDMRRCLTTATHLKPGQQPGDGQEPEHGAVRARQGKSAAPGPDLRALPDKHAGTATVDKRQAGKVNDTASLLRPPDTTEMCPQDRKTHDIQLAAQAYHDHAVALAD